MAHLQMLTRLARKDYVNISISWDLRVTSVISPALLGHAIRAASGNALEIPLISQGTVDDLRLVGELIGRHSNNLTITVCLSTLPRESATHQFARRKILPMAMPFEVVLLSHHNAGS